MKITIDGAGRVVIPKPIREALGLKAGTELDIAIDGVAIRIDGPDAPEPKLVERDGFLFIEGVAPSDVGEEVRRMREERLDYLENLGRE